MLKQFFCFCKFINNHPNIILSNTGLAMSLDPLTFGRGDKGVMEAMA